MRSHDMQNYRMLVEGFKIYIPLSGTPVSIKGIISHKNGQMVVNFLIGRIITHPSNKAYSELATGNNYYFSLIIISFNACFWFYPQIAEPIHNVTYFAINMQSNL